MVHYGFNAARAGCIMTVHKSIMDQSATKKKFCFCLIAIFFTFFDGNRVEESPWVPTQIFGLIQLRLVAQNAKCKISQTGALWIYVLS
jgi:hypothetical protein